MRRRLSELWASLKHGVYSFVAFVVAVLGIQEGREPPEIKRKVKCVCGWGNRFYALICKKCNGFTFSSGEKMRWPIVLAVTASLLLTAFLASLTHSRYPFLTYTFLLYATMWIVQLRGDYRVLRWPIFICVFCGAVVNFGGASPTFLRLLIVVNVAVSTCVLSIRILDRYNDQDRKELDKLITAFICLFNLVFVVVHFVCFVLPSNELGALLHLMVPMRIAFIFIAGIALLMTFARGWVGMLQSDIRKIDASSAIRERKRHWSSKRDTRVRDDLINHSPMSFFQRIATVEIEIRKVASWGYIQFFHNPALEILARIHVFAKVACQYVKCYASSVFEAAASYLGIWREVLVDFLIKVLVPIGIFFGWNLVVAVLAYSATQYFLGSNWGSLAICAVTVLVLIPLHGLITGSVLAEPIPAIAKKPSFSWKHSMVELATDMSVACFDIACCTVLFYLLSGIAMIMLLGLTWLAYLCEVDTCFSYWYPGLLLILWGIVLGFAGINALKKPREPSPIGQRN